MIRIFIAVQNSQLTQSILNCLNN